MMKLRLLSPLVVAAIVLAWSPSAWANVTLANIFQSGMVIQQQMPIRIWGTAEPGEQVTVSMARKTTTTKAGDDGTWKVELPPLKASWTEYSISIKGKNAVALEKVLVGEVWICSGQSNMEWGVGQSHDAANEIAAANLPQIRLFNVPGHTVAPLPQPDVPGSWQACSPQTIGEFSGVGYFFGRTLLKGLDVPIGLIGTNWGGTRIEPWTPPEGFDKVESLKGTADEVRGRNKESKVNQNQPAAIYNAMVHGLTPLSVRGAIWYQGESNANDGLGYAPKQRALVHGWRSVFQNPELSFYWVQLADFQAETDNPAGGGWGPVREAQRRALDLPHTGMAVIIDIGDAKNIHPQNKQDVGSRLARWALHQTYGRKDIVPSGPLYKSMAVEGDKVRIHFDHVDGGLMVGKKEGLNPTQEATGTELARFSIQAADGKWHWAKAKIDGETVVIWAEGVADPKHVRYAYESNPAGCNLYNKTGLPASPFTTD